MKRLIGDTMQQFPKAKNHQPMIITVFGKDRLFNVWMMPAWILEADSRYMA